MSWKSCNNTFETYMIQRKCSPFWYGRITVNKRRQLGQDRKKWLLDIAEARVQKLKWCRPGDGISGPLSCWPFEWSKRKKKIFQAARYALSTKMEQRYIADCAGAQVYPSILVFWDIWANVIQGAWGEVDQVWEIATKSSAEDHDRRPQEEQQPCADPEGDGQCLPKEPATQVCIQWRSWKGSDGGSFKVINQEGQELRVVTMLCPIKNLRWRHPHEVTRTTCCPYVVRGQESSTPKSTWNHRLSARSARVLSSVVQSLYLSPLTPNISLMSSTLVLNFR